MTEVRWGIVGAGRIAGTFAADIRHAPHATLTAVAARKRSDAERFARSHGVARAHGGYAALFADESVDAVYIATPHSLHLPHALAALKAGKAVLCEKPLTTSVDECRQLLDAASRAGVYLMEALWTWFLPAIRQAQAWVVDGRIGEVEQVSADFGFRAPFDAQGRLYNSALAGGCLLDIGIYPLALFRLLAGGAPDRVQASARFAPTGVEDHLVAVLDYPQFLASFATSFRCELPNRAVIAGREGRIEIPSFWAASEATLLVPGCASEVFRDERAGSGFEFQIEAVSLDLLAGKRESARVPHAVSQGLQEDMARVRACHEQSA